MHHTIALATSLASLGLLSAIYYCNVLAPESSWLRSETLCSILVSTFVGLMPLALTAPLIGLWEALSAELSINALIAASADLASLAVIFMIGWMFKALVKATYLNTLAPNNVSPMTPRPANSGRPVPTRKLAA